MTPSQTSVLATLDNNGEMTMTSLASHESIAPPSATGIVGRLVDKGLVDRRLDPSDLRSAIVAITPAGVSVLEQRRRERTAYLARRLEALSEDERDVLVRAIDILEQLNEEA